MARFPFFWRSLLPSAGMLRVSVYAMSVAAIAIAIAGHSLLASAKEAALAAGNQLAGLGDLTAGAEAIQLNGERFHHAVTSTELPVAEVLDRFERHCAENPNFIGNALLELSPEALAALKKPLPHAFRHGFVRDEKDDVGMVACFVGDQPGGLAELPRKLEAFLETGDLTSFGRVRYVHARKMSSGRTRVMTLWTDEGLNVARMFPGDEDAPGEDPRILARPEAAQRILSASVENLPYGLFVYELSTPAERVKRAYDHWARENGWSAVPPKDGRGSFAYVREDGFQAFLILSEHRGRSHLTIVESGRPHGMNTVAVQAHLVE